MKKRQILLLILFLTIGFAGVATTLFIAGRTKIGFNENFYDEIYFSKSIEDSIDTSEESIIDSGKKITYKTKELKTIGDKSILEYTILNNSKQYTAHGVVSLVYEELANIKVTNTLTEFDLEAGNTIDGILTVELVKSVEEDIEIPIEVIIDINPKEQEVTNITTTTKESETDTPTITIDTNGGMYEGQEGKIIKTFQSGETYNVLEPIKEGYEFLGWETSIEGVIVDNTITLGKKHLTIKATWREIPKDYKVQINDKKYESISKALEEANTSDTLILLKDVAENFTNTKTVTIDLGGFTLISEIINDGNLTLKNGTVENENTVITNNGELTLGENDGSVDETIKVVSSSTGIKQQGILNLYDGYIEGILAVEGNVTKVADEYYAYVDHLENNLQKLYLTDTISRAVVKIESNGVTYYNNLQDAINVASKNNNTISAIRNFEASYELTIPEESSITFDIASFTVKPGNNLINNGELILTNTGEEGSIIFANTIVNNNFLKLKNVTILSVANTNTLENKKTLAMEKSILGAKLGYALYITEDDTELVMDNKSLITSEQNAVYNNANTVFDNIIVTSINNYAIYNYDEACLTINDGKINGKVGGIYNKNKNVYPKLIVNGGVIRGNRAIEASYPHLPIEISGGTIEGNSFGIYYGNVNILGGTIKGSTAIYAYGNVVDGNVIGEKIGFSCSSYNDTTITGGTIASENGNAIVAIYGINIGKKDGELKDYPIIQGKLYGISGSKIKYYDGIIKGITGTIDTKYDDIEAGKITENGIEKIGDDTYFTDRLIDREYFIKVNDVEYNSFESAIDSIDKNGVIELLKSANYTNIDITKDKEITIDLKGNNLYLGVSTITNNGTLIIKDSSEETKGMIFSEKSAITNSYSKSLTINEGIIFSSSTYAIYNSGTVIISGGTVEGKISGIYYGNINVLGGTIKGEKGIYSSSGTISGGLIIGEVMGIDGGNITINGGNIKGTSYGVSCSNIIVNGGIVEGKIAINATGEITDGTIIGEKTGIKGTTIKITGGTITSKTGNAIESPYDVTVGSKGGELKDIPVIQGELYGISGARVKFYDGIIKGIVGAVDTDYNDTEEGKIIKTDEEKIGEKKYITNKLTERENFIRVDNVEYNSFESAIEAIENIGCIELMKTTSYSNIIIPKEKNITLDLNGNTLMLGSSSITNNGELTIIDTTDGIKGTISSSGIAINNNYRSSLNIEDGSIISTNSYAINNFQSITNVLGGTIDGKTYGIYGGTINVSGGLIKGGTAIYNSYSTTTITDGVILGEQYGISEGTIAITGGTIESKIGNAVQNPTKITIGTKDNNIKDIPIIKGKLYGVYGSEIKYYDGTIKGTTGAANRDFYDIESNTIVETTTEEIDGEQFVINKLIRTGNFVKVGNLEYDNLQKAIEETISGETLLITKNASIDYNVIVPEDKELTINLNNNYVKTNKVIYNYGKLSLIDTNESGLGIIYGLGANNVLINYKELDINNIVIQNELSTNNLILLEDGSTTTFYNLSITRGGSIINKGNLIIDYSNIISQSSMNNYDKGVVNISNSTIGGAEYRNYYGMYNNGKVYMHDSTIYYLSNSGISEIKNSTIYQFSQQKDSSNSIIHDSTCGTSNNNCSITLGAGLISSIKDSTVYGTITIGQSMIESEISGNEFTNGKIINSSPNLSLNNNTINSDRNPVIENNYNGFIIGNNNTINVKNGESYVYNVLRTYNNSITTLKNSNIIVENKYPTYAIHSRGQSQINFISSDISLKNGSTGYGIYTDENSIINLDDSNINIEGDTSCGIYIKSGTVNVGEADTSENRGTINASVSKTKPLIQAVGTTSGIGIKKEAGYLNFYDGKIVGSHESIAEPASDVEYNYELTRHVDADTGYKYAILEFMG